MWVQNAWLEARRSETIKGSFFQDSQDGNIAIEKIDKEGKKKQLGNYDSFLLLLLLL